METGHQTAHGAESEHKSGAANATRQGIAIVSFVAIAIIGMAIAVYAARFVPNAVGGLGSAAAYVSSLFVPTEEPAKTPTPSKPVATSTPVVTTPVVETPVVTTPNPTTTPKPVTKPTVTYSGYGDITATILSTGYCATHSGASFIASNTIPSGARYGGATFSFTNLGTNIVPSGWQYRVDTSGGSVTSYGVQLYPSQAAAGILCFDRVTGTNYVTVTADSSNQVRESIESNNTASRTITASGSGNGNNSNNDLSCELTASDRSITDGDYTTLRWDTTDADSARINQGIGSVDEDGGSERVRPRSDTTYRMTVEDRDGNTETCSVTIRVD